MDRTKVQSILWETINSKWLSVKMKVGNGFVCVYFMSLPAIIIGFRIENHACYVLFMRAFICVK